MIPTLQPPEDGFMDIEKLFIKDLLMYIYREINDPISRFIIMAHYECGYNQVEIAEIIGVTQPSVFKRIKKVQNMLQCKRKDGDI